MTITAPTAAPAAEAAPAKKKSRKKLVFILVAVLLVVGGGGFVYLKILKKPAAPTSSLQPGAVLRMPTQTLNLADGHLLQVGYALQLTTTADKATIVGQQARIQNAALNVLSPYTFHALLTQKTKQQAQRRLTAAVQHVVATAPTPDGSKPPSGSGPARTGVLRAFFTAFLMQ